MSVVGLDPSLTACGIAVLNRRPNTVDAYITSGNLDAAVIADLRAVGHRGRDAASWDERSDRVVAQARHIVKCVPADAELVVIEGPSYGSAHGHAFDRAGLWMGVYSALRARRIPIAVCAPGTRAKWATGSGRASKGDVVRAVRDQWVDSRIRSDNEADALTLAGMGALHLGWPLPFEIKDRHHAGLEVIAWPKETVR